MSDADIADVDVDGALRELAFASALSAMNRLHVSERKHLRTLLRRMLAAENRVKARRLQDIIIKTYGGAPGFARRTRRIMHDRGLSSKKLAAKLRVSKQRISALLSGRCKLTKTTIAKVASVLQVEESQLTAEVDE